MPSFGSNDIKGVNDAVPSKDGGVDNIFPFFKPYTVKDGGLTQEDYDFLKQKQTEICNYFQFRMLIAGDNIETKRYGTLWNWSLLTFKSLFKSV